jgi:hypothetical protein
MTWRAQMGKAVAASAGALVVVACSGSSSPTTTPTNTGGGSMDAGPPEDQTLASNECTGFAGAGTPITATTGSSTGPVIKADGTVYSVTLSDAASGNGYHTFSGNLTVKLPSAGTLYLFGDGALAWYGMGVGVHGATSLLTTTEICFATAMKDDSGQGPDAIPCTYSCNTIQYGAKVDVTGPSYDLIVDSGDINGVQNPAEKSYVTKIAVVFVASN